MSSQTIVAESRLASTAEIRSKRLPDCALGMIIFIGTEVMLFAALLSAHTIARATAMGGVWPPASQPRLPVERTAINTAILFLSGILLYLGSRRMNVEPERAQQCVAGAILTAVAFVLLQGVEWVALLREGLTMTSSNHGAYFYLIVGAHAIHASVAIVALTYVYFMKLRGKLTPSILMATQVFWYFVVLLWPVIYLRVYL